MKHDGWRYRGARGRFLEVWGGYTHDENDAVAKLTRFALQQGLEKKPTLEQISVGGGTPGMRRRWIGFVPDEVWADVEKLLGLVCERCAGLGLAAGPVEALRYKLDGWPECAECEGRGTHLQKFEAAT